METVMRFAQCLVLPTLASLTCGRSRPAPPLRGRLAPRQETERAVAGPGGAAAVANVSMQDLTP
jgi:hypothetical protein